MGFIRWARYFLNDCCSHCLSLSIPPFGLLATCLLSSKCALGIWSIVNITEVAAWRPIAAARTRRWTWRVRVAYGFSARSRAVIVL